MRNYAILRLLLAAFFLYVAWPFIPEATLQIEMVFWGIWLSLFLLVVGANFSTLLRMTEAPVMEQESLSVRQTRNH